MEITGTIVHIFETKKVNDKLTIREFVVNTGGNYPQEILMQLANKNIDKLNDKDVQDTVTVHINIRGRKASNGDNKWFNTIEAWKID